MKPGQLCANCLLRANCAYTRIFETFITEQPPPFLKGLDTSPRPFIFEPHDQNRIYHAGDILWLDLILIGNVIDFVPYVVFAIMQMGQTGLGVKRHQFELAAAYCFQPENESPDSPSTTEATAQQNWRLLYDGASQCILFTPNALQLSNGDQAADHATTVTLKFLTQTRLKFGDDLTMNFTFRMLAFKMLRRVLELAYFYGPKAEINWEFHDLLVAANQVHIKSRNFDWVDYDRYSNRQQAKMKLGGFVGDMTVEGDLSPFMDLLHYSEILHVGKGTTFGLGRCVIEHG